jgi:hypothetical protein
MDQYTRFKKGGQSIEERLLISRVLKDAAEEMNQKQRKVVDENHLIRTGFLKKSISYSVDQNRLQLAFAKYLRFIDMGAGSGKDAERHKAKIYNSIVWYYKGRIEDRLFRNLTENVIQDLKNIENDGSN